MKKRIIFKSDALKVENGVFQSERFSSLMDCVTVSFEIKKVACEVEFSLFSFDKTSERCCVYSQKLSPNEEKRLFEYSFDPISLAVYKNAVDFSCEIKKDGGVLEIERLIIAESIPEKSESDTDSIDNTCIDGNGNSVVKVLTLSGSEIIVPRIPKKVLFIGNSLVFGMGGYGMCSSAPDKDYYHYVTEYIKKYNPNCSFDKLYGSFFEHSENLSMFEKWYNEDVGLNVSPPIAAVSKFTDDLDLVFIQLGDNVNTNEKVKTFLETKDILIERIKKASPRARIIWIHGWYNKARTEDPIKEVCAKWNIERIDISHLRSRETEAHEQKYYYNVAEGKIKEVKETWITHPGDLGMRKIADKIMSVLKLEK